MALPVDLVAEFAKTTYDDNKVKQPVVAYATAVINQEGYFVRLDGSDLTTPAVFAVKAHNGDRVLISIQNRTVVVTNNITTPSITTGILEANTGIIVHGYFTTNEDRVTYNDQNHNGLTFSAGGIGAYGTNGYWYVTDSGNLYASNVELSGTITATGGAIAGFTIASDKLYSNSKSSISHANSGVYIGTDGIALGANSPFKVTSAGVLTATGVDITGKITASSGFIGSSSNGFTIDQYGIYSGEKTGNTNGYITLSNSDFTRTVAGSSRTNLRFAIGANFGVSNSGVVYATNADISGKITASSGKIGNFDISTAIYSNNKTTLTSSNSGVYIGTDGISLGSGSTFKVTNAGALTASNATITGTITANSGSIGMFTIANESDSSCQSKTSANGGHRYPKSLYTHRTIGNVEYEAGLKGDGNTDGAAIFYVLNHTAGATWSSADAVFSVNNKGAMKATAGDVAGWGISNYQIASGTAIDTSITTEQTQRQVFVRSKVGSSGDNPDGTTPAFGVQHRSYTNGTYGSWVWDFYVNYNGKIYATAGTIAGWDLSTYQISKSSSINTSSTSEQTQYHVFMRALNTDGSSPTVTGNSITPAFAVLKRTYTNGTYSSWATLFSVNYQGYLKATSGKIGPWDLTENCISRGSGYNNSAANSMYFGTSGLSVKNKFVVDPDGNVYCKGGSLHLEDISNSDRAQISFPSMNIINTGSGTSINETYVFSLTVGTSSNGYGQCNVNAFGNVTLYGKNIELDTMSTIGGATNNGTITISGYDLVLDPDHNTTINGSSITLKGPVYIRNGVTRVVDNDIRRLRSGYTRGTAPSSALYASYVFSDKDESTIAYMQSALWTNGSSALRLFVETPTAAGGNASGITLEKNTAGTLNCGIGGTTSIEGNVYSKMTGFTRGVAPSSNTYRGFTFTDSVNTRLGIFEVGELTNGNAELHMYLSTPTTGTANEQSGILLKKDSSGTLTCAIAGDTSVTGHITATATMTAGSNSATTYAVKAINSTGSIQLRIASTGTRGVYDETEGSWIIYRTSDSTVNNVSGALTVSGNINIVSTAASSYAVGVQNSVGKVQLYMASNGNMGVYDATNSKYIIYKNSSGNLYMQYALDATVTGSNLVITSSGQVGKTSSSRRYKHDIKALTDYRKILDIPVVSFVYNNDCLSKEDQRYGQTLPGFIAEDVAKHYSIAADRFNDKVEDWNIRFIVPPMLAVEQDHEKRLAALEAENATLKEKIAQLMGGAR